MQEAKAEGWGEGIKKASALIILPPHPRLLPQGEGVRALWEKGLIVLNIVFSAASKAVGR